MAINDLAAESLGEAERQLATKGWAFLRNAGFMMSAEAVDMDQIYRLATRFGVPSQLDGGTSVWRVQPQTNDAGETFSRRAGKALLHTDAAYRPDPEPLFALFCVRPAVMGGVTRLLSWKDASAQLDASVRRELVRPIWRWSSPRIFGHAQDIYRRVLSGNDEIRWRLDNLDVAPTDMRIAQDFADYLENHPDIIEFTIPRDAMLICDNQRMLHGRTWFEDPDRLLLRVRLTAHAHRCLESA